MPTSQYASSFGRLQAISLNLLSKDVMQNLLKGKDENEMVKMLESTWYKPDIERAASIFKESELLEVALNRHLVEVNKIALEATPFNGKSAVRAYLSKWDIYNIELILSAKSTGRPITETESFLVSSRNVPAGISAGNIPHDEMKVILAQTGVDGVVNQLVKYNYGTILMQHLETYQKTGDLGPMMSALQTFYYQNLFDSLKFFQGDEGTIRDLFRAEIDKKNLLNLLKAKESNLDKDLLSKHLIDGGKMGVVGERELVIGYRLLGIDDTFVVSGEEASKTIQELFASGKFTLIIASESVRNSIPVVFRKKIESSIEPLVIFMPAMEGNIQEESIAALAKRVLGISIPTS